MTTEIPLDPTTGFIRMRVEPSAITESQALDITRLKHTTAQLVDMFQNLADIGGEAGRLARIAMQEYEQACMWGVKALTANEVTQEVIRREEERKAPGLQVGAEQDSQEARGE